MRCQWVFQFLKHSEMTMLYTACSKCNRLLKMKGLVLKRQIIRNFTTNASSYKVDGRRRVVVTGIGLVTCLGLERHNVWRKLLDGECGIVKLTGKEYEQIPSRIAGLVNNSSGEHKKKIDDIIPLSQQRNMSQGSVYALMATEQALCDAGWRPETVQEKVRSGVAIGMGLTGMLEVWQTGRDLEDRGYRKVSPYFMTKILVNMAAGQVSLHYGLQGPNHSVSTACTTGLHAIGDAMRFIQRGDAEVMLAGGSEESPNPLSMAGFSRMRALCTKYNDDPTSASRPFDKEREGFVMSEGAGILVLEELSHAKHRNANIYAEILGYGLSGDAHHITAPREDGDGAYRCMSAAISDSHVRQSDIGYINAHATSTPLGDRAESIAISRLFTDSMKLPLVSSTKGALGHLLGAAGSVETAITVMACKEGVIPPTINLYNPDTGVPLDYVPLKARNWDLENGTRTALTNSFGFGGTNGSLCIQYSDDLTK